MRGSNENRGKKCIVVSGMTVRKLGVVFCVSVLVCVLFFFFKQKTAYEITR